MIGGPRHGGGDAEGDIDALSLGAGQSAGLVSKLEPAGDIVRSIAAQTDLILPISVNEERSHRSRA